MGEQAKEHKGRSKGTPNKNTQALFDKAEELQVDPFEILLNFAKGDYEALGYNKYQTESAGNGKTYEVLTIPPETQMKAAEKCCAYLYPKRKSIEFQGGAEDASIEVKIVRFSMAKHAPQHVAPREPVIENKESGLSPD